MRDEKNTNEDRRWLATEMDVTYYETRLHTFTFRGILPDCCIPSATYKERIQYLKLGFAEISAA